MCLAVVLSESSPRTSLLQTLHEHLRIDEESLKRITKNRFDQKKQLSSQSNAKVADGFMFCCSGLIYTSSRPAERTFFQEALLRKVSNSRVVPGNVVFVSLNRG